MPDEVILGRVLPLIFVLIGSGLLIGAARLYVRTRSFLSRATETPGEVVALKEEPPMEAGERTTYRPVVAFRTGAAQRIEFESTAHSAPASYDVGASVRVLYDPEHPEDARIRSFVSLWLLPIILGGLGLIFTAAGAAVLMGRIPL